MSEIFKVNNLEFKYCRSEANNAYKNERTVEVPTGKWALDIMLKYGPVVEIGDVMWHYYPISHVVIDLYEKRDGVANINFLDFDPSGTNVLSISTIEHIGHAEYNRPSIPNGFMNAMNSIVNRAKLYFITLPIGFRDDITNFIKDSKLQKAYLYLQSDFSWKQIPIEEFSPKFYSGIAYNVAVFTNIKEFWK